MKVKVNPLILAVSAALATIISTALWSVLSSTPLSAIATTDGGTLAKAASNKITHPSLPSASSLPAVILPITTSEETSVVEPVAFWGVAGLSLYFFFRSNPKRR